MKFGILYNIDYQESVHGSPSDYYGQILTQVVRAEELGYHAAWFGEHHYAAYSFGSPATIATAAAARTSRIRLGTGVSLLPLHHPIRLAEEYAMLDQLSGGRLDYGVGRGFLKLAYDLFGIPEDESRERYRESLEVILRAWTTREPFSHRGKYWDFEDCVSFPPPFQEPCPPIFASGAATPSSYTWAGDMGVNLATAFFNPRHDVVQAGIRSYRDALREQGIDPADRQVVGVIPMYCAATEEEVLRGWEHTARYLAFFAGLDRSRPHQAQDYEHYRGESQGSQQMGDMTFETFDRGNLSLIGGPERIIGKLRWIDEFYDRPDLLLMEVAQGGLDPSLVIPTLELFAETVMPEFA